MHGSVKNKPDFVPHSPVVNIRPHQTEFSTAFDSVHPENLCTASHTSLPTYSVTFIAPRTWTAAFLMSHKHHRPRDIRYGCSIPSSFQRQFMLAKRGRWWSKPSSAQICSNNDAWRSHRDRVSIEEVHLHKSTRPLVQTTLDAAYRTCPLTAANQAPTNDHILKPAIKETEARIPKDHMVKDIYWSPQRRQPFLGWSRNRRSSLNRTEVTCHPKHRTAQKDLSLMNLTMG